MSDPIKHECAVAMLRLLKSPEYYREKYGSSHYGYRKLLLLLEKQHNRGQDGAGIVSLSFNPEPGKPAYNICKSAAANPLPDLLERIGDADGYRGELLLGHLRYATFGKNDVGYCHPFVHESTCLERLFMLAGNFNLTSGKAMMDHFLATGHHPSATSDGYLLTQTIAHYLEQERDSGLKHIRWAELLRNALEPMDGAFTLCGMNGMGDSFAIRDARGIRPGYYYMDDEVVVVASERPAIQAAFNLTTDQVKELPAGQVLVIRREGDVSFQPCLPEQEHRSCVFERIYFSRGNDADICRERKALGRALMPAILKQVDEDFEHSVFSYIPNSALLCYQGLVDSLNEEAAKRGTLARSGQVAVKDAKFRTFISDEESRKELYMHVYDVTYGVVEAHKDALVVVDDSIVRGNTVRNAVLPILDRLAPRKIVMASSAPPVKYPDCYGIDMSTTSELIAFRAAVSVLRKHGREHVLREAYNLAKVDLNPPHGHVSKNRLKMIYDAVDEQELIQEIARMLTPVGLKAEFTVVYQTCEDLRKCCPNHTGDWYFTGDYPTPGGNAVANRALVNFMENKKERAY